MEDLSNYIDRESKILVALSGGPDSMYLLEGLREYRRRVPFTLEAAHLHHGLRKEADDDLAFVEDISRRWEIPLHIARVDVKALAEKEGRSVEEAGRIARYRFFRARKKKGGLIALGHHLDDQIETMLLRLIRGTGLDGLCGMKVLEGDLFRPLLSMRKREILEELAEREIPYVLDRSNDEAVYTRNKIRLDLIPVAEAINPRFIDGMASFRERILDDASYLEKAARDHYPNVVHRDELGLYADPSIFNLSRSIRTRLFRLAIESVRGDLKNISYEHIRAVEGLKGAESGKGVDLPGFRVQNSYGKLYFFTETAKEEKAEEVKFEGGEAIFHGHRFVVDGAGDRFIRIEDLEKIRIRARRPGDKIKLEFGHKKIKDLMIDEKIDRRLRDTWPLIVENDEVIWVPGVRKAYRQEDERWKKIVWFPR